MSPVLDTAGFARALPVLKCAARRTVVVIPLLRVTVAHPPDVAVVVCEQLVTRWTRQRWRRCGRRGRREPLMRFCQGGSAFIRMRIRGCGRTRGDSVRRC